jgi:hypothetical protein
MQREISLDGKLGEAIQHDDAKGDQEVIPAHCV